MTTYTEYLPASGLRTSTITSTMATIARFERWLDGRPITPETLAAWRQHLGRCNIKPSVKNLVLARIGAMLRWQVRQGGLPGLTMDAISAMSARFPVDRDAVRVLDKAEIARLAAACHGSQTGRTVLALLLSGARYNELMRLTPDNLTGAGIEITGASSKNRQGRIIPWFLLGAGRALFAPLPFIFSRREWVAIRAQAGLDVPLKTTRSTWVSYAAYAGKLPMVSVAKTAGHTLAVCEKNYLGAPMFGLTGDSMPEWMGLSL